LPNSGISAMPTASSRRTCWANWTAGLGRPCAVTPVASQQPADIFAGTIILTCHTGVATLSVNSLRNPASLVVGLDDPELILSLSIDDCSQCVDASFARAYQFWHMTSQFLAALTLKLT
jgi:hypothetical protein